MTWTWVEPFAGAAACALRLVGGRDLTPPVSWMGGKRRLARAILDALGVPEERPARVLLADAGPWGWVWPLLLAPESAARVAAVLRSWADEHPRDLWRRLAAQPPAEDLHERAAQWLWLQARSASGVPIWWDGWRLRVEGRSDPQSTWDRFGESNAGRWQAMNGRGTPSTPGFNTGQAARDGARWEKGTPDGRAPQDATNGQRGAVWRASNGQGDEVEAGQKGLGGWRTARGQTGGLVDPRTIAARAEAIALAFSGVEWDVHHGDARAHADARGIAPTFRSGQEGCDCVDCDGAWCVWCLEHHGRRPCPVDEERKAATPRVPLGKPTFVYLDPPYVGATGYGWNMPRAEVLALALRWQDAGAVVAVSEAEPLDLPGWHHLELTREGGKPEWLTLSRAPARLPERQSLLFAADAP